ncbi:uncharacterized protein F5891DRAFT_1198291 [Suillus fuscotomentosus]|uniref:Uncharacterized protein n=1 Tax=Suillus fuscotomentosus TaxID=1912939 RepID=A0AAD4DS33_9AGAM|nr:uncharacterized protein F5891DRAFT_1198291 [Suillus fuscotomentosus]KAG1889814.1 hypothetical protein F5891DRAFT_1198291 [Suillus fuscotomentosus]
MQLATYSTDGPSSLKHWEILVPIKPAKNEEFKNHYPQSLRKDERGWDMFFVGLELYLNAYWLIKPHGIHQDPSRSIGALEQLTISGRSCPYTFTLPLSNYCPPSDPCRDAPASSSSASHLSWRIRNFYLWIHDGPSTGIHPSAGLSHILAHSSIFPVCMIIMLHPPVHKTEQKNFEASQERCQHHYAKDGILSRRRGLRLTKPSQEVQEIQRALAVALGYDEDLSEPETSDDENDALSIDLPSCLLAFKSIKDEMLVLIGEPCAFTESLLLQYVKSLPDEVHGKGDTSIIQNAKTEVERLLRRATRVQDQIIIFCGVSTESRATESVSRFLSTTLAYIDDIQYFLDIEGLTELTVAHSMGELMYQKRIRI